ncbi:putative transporter C460.05-like protein 4 [Colletotrichum chlorophyti]|uniref:Putative transporter C460.05-like protein 4 n=1 Tax=Colletotrichum chlorophyti TaxID=708187 RepID=A0A1Q8RX11_9PEZI|nr:putative transporter C460.05-like protein 4 [Colletotrichum chlorophyti]
MGARRDETIILVVEDPISSKQQTNYDLVDQEVANYASEAALQIDQATNKRLKRMIDKRVLGVMIFTYFMQSLDKGTMSFASIMGVIPDTNLQDQEYAWLTTIIYIVVFLHAACRNFLGLVIVRGFLGAFEAVCQPAFVLLTSMWYKREEKATTAILWYMMNGLQQIVGGLLAFAFSLIPATSPLKSWQALFMSYGIIAVIWVVFVLWWMPDSPMKAHCFSEEEKRLMVESVWEVFKDTQVYAFALIQLLTTLPSGGLGAFANIIIKSTWETQLLQSVTGVLQIIKMLTAVWIERRYKQTILAMVAAVVPTIAGTVVLLTVPFTPSKKVGLLLAYYVMISFWARSGLALSLVMRNVAGQTKKGVVFRKKDEPRYFLALAIVIGCFALLEVVLLALRTYYIWQNKSRESKIARGEALADAAHTHAFEDMTDKEDVNIRYNY